MKESQTELSIVKKIGGFLGVLPLWNWENERLRKWKTWALSAITAIWNKESPSWVSAISCPLGFWRISIATDSGLSHSSFLAPCLCSPSIKANAQKKGLWRGFCFYNWLIIVSIAQELVWLWGQALQFSTEWRLHSSDYNGNFCQK